MYINPYDVWHACHLCSSRAGEVLAGLHRHNWREHAAFEVFVEGIHTADCAGLRRAMIALSIKRATIGFGRNIWTGAWPGSIGYKTLSKLLLAINYKPQRSFFLLDAIDQVKQIKKITQSLSALR